jgi:flagellar motor switch protein FliG
MVRIRMILALVALCCWNGFAQAAEGWRSSEQLGKRYEQVIGAAIGKYFAPGTYVVDTKVWLEEVLTPMEFENDAQIIDGMETLPGMPTPMQADTGERYNDSLVVSKYRKDFEVRQVEVEILVDGRYASEDLQFVTDLVRMAANLDQSRGDKIRVIRRAFPRDPETGIIQGPPVRLQDTLPPVTQALRDSLAESRDEPLVASPDQWPWWAWFAFAALSVLFLLFLILLLRRRKSDAPVLAATPAPVSELPNQAQISESKVDAQGKAGDTPSAEFTDLRNTLVNALVGSPRTAGQIFQEWLRTPEGLRRSTLALESVDYRLVRMFRKQLDEKEIQQLELCLQTFEGAEEDEKIDALRNFRTQFLALSNQTGNDRQGDLFHFLEQMSDHQLRHLIAGEPPGIKAVVMAQVRSSMAAVLMQDLDPSERSQVLVSMGQIQNITVRTYRDLAERLSAKALTLADMRYVAADGVESVVQLLLDLPTSAQSQYLQSIAEQDLELASRVRYAFVTFEEIGDLEMRQRSQILETCDRDALALALMRTEPSYVTKVLDAYPERARQALLAAMEGHVEKTLEEVEAARRVILLHVRKELLRQGGVRR